jgi:hypothetical protein
MKRFVQTKSVVHPRLNCYFEPSSPSQEETPDGYLSDSRMPKESLRRLDR